MKSITLLSYTIRRSRVYSDGLRTGVPRMTPDLAKCPNCGAIFFMHNLWAGKESEGQESLYIEEIKHPDEADYLKALEKGLAKNREEEIQVRTALWHALNHDAEYYDDKVWEDNCRALLALMEAKFDEMSKAETPATDDDDDDDDRNGEIMRLFITIMELHRNMGMFEDAAGELAQIPDDQCWFRECYQKKLDEKFRFVFELTKEEEKP
jgi:hypothetical protein